MVALPQMGQLLASFDLKKAVDGAVDSAVDGAVDGALDRTAPSPLNASLLPTMPIVSAVW